MQLNEFLIKAEAYNRIRDRELIDVKFISYHALIGSHYNPKSLPTFEEFIREGKQKEKATDAQREALLNEAAEYYRKLKERG